MLDSGMAGVNGETVCGAAVGCVVVREDATAEHATGEQVEVVRVADLAGYRHDWESVDAADGWLGEVEQAITAGDHATARAHLVEALACLNVLGAEDPDRTGPRDLGSRLLAAIGAVLGVNVTDLAVLVSAAT